MISFSATPRLKRGEILAPHAGLQGPLTGLQMLAPREGRTVATTSQTQTHPRTDRGDHSGVTIKMAPAFHSAHNRKATIAKRHDGAAAVFSEERVVK
jgi:hypothetical protein